MKPQEGENLDEIISGVFEETRKGMYARCLPDVKMSNKDWVLSIEKTQELGAAFHARRPSAGMRSWGGVAAAILKPLTQMVCAMSSSLS